MADFRFIRNLYNPWAIRQEAALSALPLIDKILNRDSNFFEGLTAEKQKETAPKIAAFDGEDLLEYEDVNDLPENSEGGVSVIKISGALTKYDYCGQPGTQTIGEWMLAADAAEEVKSHVFVYETPGGTVAGTAELSSIIQSLTKPHIALVSEECCSAGYWLASNSPQIKLMSKTCLAGCIGTMVSLRVWTDENMKEHHITSTKSNDKNKAALEARKGNYQLIQERLLDPINEVFIETVNGNRADKLDLAKEDVFTGKEYVGQAAIDAGLADGYSTLEEAITLALDMSTQKNTDMNPFKKKDSANASTLDLAKMTKEEKEQLMASLTEDLGEEEPAQEPEAAAAPEAQPAKEEPSALDQFTARFNSLEASMNKLKKENEDLKAENAKLGDKPADPLHVDAEKDIEGQPQNANYLTEVDKELMAMGGKIQNKGFSRQRGFTY